MNRKQKYDSNSRSDFVLPLDSSKCVTSNTRTLLGNSDYAPIERIGAGAYGMVIMARKKSVNRMVAIKRIHNVFDHIVVAKRTLREIRFLRHLNHENVLQLIDIIKPRASENTTTLERLAYDVCLVLDLMGSDLHHIIKSKQELTVEHIRFFMYQLFKGLKYIHSAKIIHRDLKPSNLLIDENCRLKIGDFGMARCTLGVGEMYDQPLMTQYVATRYYRAPELMLSLLEYASPIDMWSCGCIFAELFNRKPLFPGKNFIEQLKLIFDKLGNPGDDVLSASQSEIVRNYVQNFDKRTPQPWREIVPGAPRKVYDLLSRLLVYNPKQRLTAEKILGHPFFNMYHDASNEPICEEAFDFSFETPITTLPVLRKLIMAEADWYEEKNKLKICKSQAAETDKELNKSCASISTTDANNNEKLHRDVDMVGVDRETCSTVVTEKASKGDSHNTVPSSANVSIMETNINNSNKSQNNVEMAGDFQQTSSKDVSEKLNKVSNNNAGHNAVSSNMSLSPGSAYTERMSTESRLMEINRLPSVSALLVDGRRSPKTVDAALCLVSLSAGISPPSSETNSKTLPQQRTSATSVDTNTQTNSLSDTKSSSTTDDTKCTVSRNSLLVCEAAFPESESVLPATNHACSCAQTAACECVSDRHQSTMNALKQSLLEKQSLSPETAKAKTIQRQRQQQREERRRRRQMRRESEKVKLLQEAAAAKGSTELDEEDKKLMDKWIALRAAPITTTCGSLPIHPGPGSAYLCTPTMATNTDTNIAASDSFPLMTVTNASLTENNNSLSTPVITIAPVLPSHIPVPLLTTSSALMQPPCYSNHNPNVFPEGLPPSMCQKVPQSEFPVSAHGQAGGVNGFLPRPVHAAFSATTNRNFVPVSVLTPECLPSSAVAGSLPAFGANQNNPNLPTIRIPVTTVLPPPSGHHNQINFEQS